jgi:hypothetical protein
MRKFLFIFVSLFLSLALFGEDLDSAEFAALIRSQESETVFRQDLGKLIELMRAFSSEIKSDYDTYGRSHRTIDLKEQQDNDYNNYIKLLTSFEEDLDDQSVINEILFVFCGIHPSGLNFDSEEAADFQQLAVEISNVRGQEYEQYLKDPETIKRSYEKEDRSLLDKIRTFCEQKKKKRSNKIFFETLLQHLQGCNNRYQFFFKIFRNLQFLEGLKYTDDQREKQLKNLDPWNLTIFECVERYHTEFQNKIEESSLALLFLCY